MIKKLLPAMIGAALVGGMTAASADVQVKGHIDTAILNTDDGTNDDTTFVCTTCSIGFKGSEDLGNGMSAIFFLDFQYDTANQSNGGVDDRDQWLGLDTAAGQFRVGTISTLYKSHGAMIDPLYRTVVQGRDVGLQSGFHSNAGEELQGRADNTIRWDSKDFNGLKVGAHYTLDSDDTTEDNNPFGVGASYENGGILVFADYMTNDGDSNTAVPGSKQEFTGGDISVWKVGGKYSINDFAVMGQYEDAEEDVSGDEVTQWHVAGTYTFGSNMVYAGYGVHTYDMAGGSEVDTDAFTIALAHSLSKSTTAYAGYNNQDPDGGDETDHFTVGMKHKF